MIIIITVVASISILPFLYVDVSVLARGFFQADIEKQILNSPFDGKVIFSAIETGKKVSRGDTLLIIESESLKSQLKILEEKITLNDKSISDLRVLTHLSSILSEVRAPGLFTDRYTSEYGNLSRQWTSQLHRQQKADADHARIEVLYKQKLIPDSEFENSLFNLNSEKEALGRIITSQKAIWQADLFDRRNDSISLYGQLREMVSELSNRVVTTSLGGEIIRSSEIQVGSYLLSGQNILEISPDGELLAICYIKPSDIGLVFPGQKVIIQVDAFNYSEWGTLSGSIIDISDDMIVEGNSSAYFRIKCRPEKNYLVLRNGYSAEMRKGMSLTARIIIARRSLFNLLFDKMNKWVNPYYHRIPDMYEGRS